MGLSSSPPTRNRTYVDGVTQIPAGDMNDAQDLEIGLCTGTKSIKAITVDGVGGAAATPVSGTIGASASVAGSSTPTPSFTGGLTYKESPPFAFCKVNAAGTFITGMNIASIAHGGTGSYTVTLSTAAASTAKMLVIIGANNVGFAFATVNTTTQISVGTRNTSGVAADVDFSLVVYVC